jgi:hypothetical protein
MVQLKNGTLQNDDDQIYYMVFGTITKVVLQLRYHSSALFNRHSSVLLSSLQSVFVNLLELTPCERGGVLSTREL